MPWCEDCQQYHAPSAMSPEGECPTCGRVLDEPPRVTAKNVDVRRLAAGGDEDGDAAAPWHFKLLMVLLVLYMVWRIYNLFR